MSFWSKKLRILAVLLVTWAVVWTYRTYDRYREIREFFTNPEDLVWAGKYIDQGIDFCNDTSLGKTLEYDNQGRDTYSSPSLRYSIEWNDRYSKKDMIFDGESYFYIIETQDVPPLKDDEFLLIPKYRWTKDERFLMFYLENWWVFPKIFIVDVATGKNIYLGRAKPDGCVLPEAPNLEFKSRSHG